MCYSTHVTELTLLPESGTSICDQAVYAAKKALISGQMRPGEPFPSVRSLSQTLKINPNTAHKIISRLTAEGVLTVKPGIGTIVAEPPAENLSGRNSLLKNDLERVVVEAKRAGLKLEELTAALSYHWTRLSPI
ncbi:MAG: GntR family transcriptional regulator [Acidobacteriia bacterium]|nr:GntR family transcriptional regulator [Terriglobia bacterium]